MVLNSYETGATDGIPNVEIELPGQTMIRRQEEQEDTNTISGWYRIQQMMSARLSERRRTHKFGYSRHQHGGMCDRYD